MVIDKTAVIGFPVDHSLSPAIHNYWIKKLGLDIKPYEKINVNPNTFEEQISAESKAQTIAGKTEDSKIVVMSFIQKQKAKFKGK